MRIFSQNTGTQKLTIEFTDEDMENPLFTTTTIKVLSKYEGELKNNTLTITPSEKQQLPNMGLVVDDIREDYMGDVIPPELDREEEEVIQEEIKDEKTGEILQEWIVVIKKIYKEKDLSNCPCLSFTPPPQPELELEEGVVDDGTGIQDII